MAEKKKQKYFRFWSRVYPGEHALKPDKGVREQPIFLELSTDEAKTIKMRGVPLMIEHVNGTEVKARKSGAPFRITYPKDKYALGYISDQMVLDNGTMLLMGEIPLGGAGETLPARALKKTVISMIKGGHYGVSLLHAVDQAYDVSQDAEVVRKYPVEVSLTTNPGRSGAEILEYDEADSPSFLQENNYDVYRAASESLINWTAVDANDEKIKMAESANTNMQAPPAAAASSSSSSSAPATAGAKQWRPEEIASILKANAEFKEQIDRLKPLADEYIAKKRAEDEAQRKKVAQNIATLNADAQKMLKQLLESGIEIAPEDKTAMEAIVKVGEKEPTQADDVMTRIITNEGREKGPAPTPAEMWANLDHVVSNDLIKPIAAFNTALGYANKLMQSQASQLALNNRAAGKAATASSSSSSATSSAGAKVTAQEQQKRPAEPNFAMDLKRIGEYAIAKSKQYEVPDDFEIPK